MTESTSSARTLKRDNLVFLVRRNASRGDVRPQGQHIGVRSGTRKLPGVCVHDAQRRVGVSGEHGQSRAMKYGGQEVRLNRCRAPIEVVGSSDLSALLR